MYPMNLALWIAQWLLAVTFVGAAAWKAFTPKDKLATMIPWSGEVAPWKLHAIVAIDLLGGLGVILPSLTRIAPELTIIAALGCALLMASAIGFHVRRGEGKVTPFNFFLLALTLFVAWGRWKLAPIAPR